MRSGGAILSRFPIRASGVQLFEKPASNAWLYNVFYLSRYLAWAEVQHPDRTIQIFNTHLEAFDEPNRIAQAERTRSIIASRLTPWTIYGGDFNTVPPESTKKSGYPDEDRPKTAKTEHTHDRTLTILRAIPGLSDVLPAAELARREEDFFTFPAHAPNRKLDYLFAGDGFEVAETRVVKEAGDVSDHLPLCSKLSLRRN
jgi:endonuclease/exonuclease/phosphatase family metal-dependent hydrolase